MSNDIARKSGAWPFEQARKLIERLDGQPPAKGYVLFETGYGPSGLPHIGTFGEVVRTSMVRRAFRELAPEVPTRLFAFSDDMDGLRRVPDNIPNAAAMAPHLGKPLTAIPDPFGTHDSFGAHNNARLRAFLDSFGFDYEFMSATECYRAGMFDQTLLRILAHYDAVTAVILPTLGPERRATYSPFLPLCPRTGRVLQVPIIAHDAASGTVAYRDEDGTQVEVPVTGGRCKLQWKADWAMRWVALGVDYEMAGKDLIDSVKLSSAICRVLGGRPPEGFNYELFLDAKGQKISKSKGNGLTVEEWLRYGPPESLSLFMYQSPKSAKRLHFDVIPRQVDDYLAFLADFAAQDAKIAELAHVAAPTAEQSELALKLREKQLSNPVWHIHAGAPPRSETGGLSFSVMLNLAGVANTEDKAVLWGFIARYRPDATPATQPMLDRLVGHAIAYYQDFVKPAKRHRAATEIERAALEDLVATLEKIAPGSPAEVFQTEVYEVGKRHAFAALKDWFAALYAVLFGQSEGPRMGSFIALYGRDETVALIRRALAGELVQAQAA